MSTLRRGMSFVGLAVLGALALAACGGPDDADSAPPTTVANTVTTSPSSTSTEEPSAPPPTTAPSTAAPLPTLPPTTTLPFDDSPVTGETIDVVFNTLENSCATCHAPGGPGSTHWELTTFGDASRFADTLAQDTSARIMPPWPASDLGLDFVGDLSLDHDEISAIRSWAAAGAPLGDRDETTPVEVRNPLGADFDGDIVVAAAEPYRGSGAVVDDYRCQIYDPGLTGPTWLRGWSFEPDRTEVIHHAVVFAADAEVRAEADARDSAEGEAPGWTCYGLSGLGRSGPEPTQIMGWAPGQGATTLPDGVGLPLDAGDFLVVQVHYHYDDLIDVPADASTMTLDVLDADDISAAGGEIDPVTIERYLAPAEIPCSADESGPLCDRDAVLARIGDEFGAGSVQIADGLIFLCGASLAEFATMTGGIAESSCDHRLRDGGEIVGIFGHMHEIGAAFRMTLNPGTPGERILLDIPRWDFDWQLQYLPAESVILERGDVLRIECIWDRALRSPLLEPAWVTWAEGTNDEMCYSTVSTRPLG